MTGRGNLTKRCMEEMLSDLLLCQGILFSFYHRNEGKLWQKNSSICNQSIKNIPKNHHNLFLPPIVRHCDEFHSEKERKKFTLGTEMNWLFALVLLIHLNWSRCIGWIFKPCWWNTRARFVYITHELASRCKYYMITGVSVFNLEVNTHPKQKKQKEIWPRHGMKSIFICLHVTNTGTHTHIYIYSFHFISFGLINQPAINITQYGCLQIVLYFVFFFAHNFFSSIRDIPCSNIAMTTTTTRWLFYKNIYIDYYLCL